MKKHNSKINDNNTITLKFRDILDFITTISGVEGFAGIAVVVSYLPKGTKVITPIAGFPATLSPTIQVGFTPIFVDIDPQTFCIDPSAIAKAITPKTKAIQVVHLYGLPAEMPAIMKLAKKHKLLVIEDAAQAHLASVEGSPVGTFGDAAAFSFYPTKNMTSGEGGMIVFKDKEAARLARLYRNQGMEKRYQNEIVGFNLRMTDIHAAIGRTQLKHLLKWSKKRQDNAMTLSSQLQNVVTPIIPNGFSHVFHQYTIRVAKNRDTFADKLSKAGVGNSVYYPTQVHKLPSFNSALSLPQTQLATETVLSLPVHPSLSKRDLKRVVNTVNSLIKEI